MLIVVTFLTLSSMAQNTWTQRSDLGGIKRRNASGFAMGHKGYIGLGYSDTTATLLGDFWEYDPATNAWTQKADFGGTARYSATSFVIDNFAYVGLGSDQYSVPNFRNDFWKFDPAANTWVQVADFPGTARYQCKGFAIGTKGFVGTGWNQALFFNDFWEYNSITDTWVQRASLPGNPREAAVSFVIGSNGYMGMGVDDNSSYQDFYKYDTTLNSWSAIANLPSIDFDGVAFVINNMAYVGGGSTTYPNLSLLSHFWVFNPVNNSWAAIADMSGSLRLSAVGFAIDMVGYVGTGGYGDATHNLNDFWEYDPIEMDVAINEVENNAQTSIFPNPASNHLNIHQTQLGITNEELRITDVLGRIVYSQLLNQSTESTIDISTLSNGIYFYEVSGSRGKFMKQ